MKDPKQFYVGVKGAIFNPTLKKVLVLSRLDQNGKRFWDIPGGRIDDSEKIETTLLRELKEEILNFNDSFTVSGLLNAYRLPRDLKEDFGLLLLFYKVESNLMEIKLSSEHDSYRWVTQNELYELDSSDIYIDTGYLEALIAAFK